MCSPVCAWSPLRHCVGPRVRVFRTWALRTRLRSYLHPTFPTGPASRVLLGLAVALGSSCRGSKPSPACGLRSEGSTALQACGSSSVACGGSPCRLPSKLSSSHSKQHVSTSGAVSCNGELRIDSSGSLSSRHHHPHRRSQRETGRHRCSPPHTSSSLPILLTPTPRSSCFRRSPEFYFGSRASPDHV